MAPPFVKCLRRHGASLPFELKRGLRESCPSSPVVFNLYPEVGLRRLQERIEGIKLKVGAVFQVKTKCIFQCNGRNPRRPGIHQMVLEEIEELTVKLLAFADDTIIPSTKKNYKADETKALEIFLETQEYVHPGKTE